MSDCNVYVSITGLKLTRPWYVLRFYWHAVLPLRQAKAASGNIRTEVKTINGVHHTLTVWEAMRNFLYSVAHAKAIKVFGLIATGKTFGYVTANISTWDDVHALWHKHGRDYDTEATA